MKSTRRLRKAAQQGSLRAFEMAVATDGDIAGAITGGAAASEENDHGVAAPSQRDLFQELRSADRDAFLARCRKQHYAAGAHLFSQGEPYTASHVIRSGVVRTYYVSPTGKEITIAYWSAGALVGGPNVFREHRPHIWSAQAATDVATQCIRGRDLEELSMKIPELAHYLIETLTFKLHWVSVLLQTFGTQSVRSRLAHLLLQLSERYGTKHDGGVLITHHFSHDELARMVGATRPWVTIAIRNLKKDAIIRCSGRHIIVVNRPALEKVVHAPQPRT
jgi:CRP/FNR family cyclic AMP-dependent transcriptional regulator